MKRKSISKRIQLEVWVRDNWTCRYCNNPVIFSPTLKLLDKISPTHGYYHTHGDEKKMIKKFCDLCATVDHKHPHSRGGAHNIDNFATACMNCNMKMNNKTNEEGKPKLKEKNDKIGQTGWDGMSSLYLKLQRKPDSWTKLLKEIEKQNE